MEHILYINGLLLDSLWRTFRSFIVHFTYLMGAFIGSAPNNGPNHPHWLRMADALLSISYQTDDKAISLLCVAPAAVRFVNDIHTSNVRSKKSNR